MTDLQLIALWTIFLLALAALMNVNAIMRLFA